MSIKLTLQGQVLVFRSNVLKLLGSQVIQLLLRPP